MSRGKTAASWTPADVSNPILGERWGGVVLHPGRLSALLVPGICLPLPLQHSPGWLCVSAAAGEAVSSQEKGSSARRLANKLTACRCTLVLEFPPMATAAWQRPATLRHGEGRPGKVTTPRGTPEAGVQLAVTFSG